MALIAMIATSYRGSPWSQDRPEQLQGTLAGRTRGSGLWWCPYVRGCGFGITNGRPGGLGSAAPADWVGEIVDDADVPLGFGID